MAKCIWATSSCRELWLSVNLANPVAMCALIGSWDFPFLFASFCLSIHGGLAKEEVGVNSSTLSLAPSLSPSLTSFVGAASCWNNLPHCWSASIPHLGQSLRMSQAWCNLKRLSFWCYSCLVNYHCFVTLCKKYIKTISPSITNLAHKTNRFLASWKRSRPGPRFHRFFDPHHSANFVNPPRLIPPHFVLKNFWTRPITALNRMNPSQSTNSGPVRPSLPPLV